MKVNKEFKLTTPVLFLVFNRLDTTKQVLKEIQTAKPQKLFIAADGPRNQEEKKKTDAVREYILESIDWNCEVKTLFREKNLGCKYAVAGAIDWYFKNVEQGIILEDDCLPSQSFFRFCQEMLERYKDDEKIMHVSGTNIEGKSKIKEDYFLSNTYNVWGWATWKRAWRKYDVEMKEWKKYNSFFGVKALGYIGILPILMTWRLFRLTYLGKIDTWDYQWDFACHLEKGYSIVPRVNLITNLGLGGGTHTSNYGDDKKLERNSLNSFRECNPDYWRKYYKKALIFFQNKRIGKFLFKISI